MHMCRGQIKVTSSSEMFRQVSTIKSPLYSVELYMYMFSQWVTYSYVLTINLKEFWVPKVVQIYPNLRW